VNNNDERREKCGREEGDLEIWGLRRGRSGELEFCMNGCAGNAA